MGLMCPACGGGWERGHFCVELARTFGPYVPDLKPAQVERRRDKSPSFEELDHRNPRRSWRP